MTKKNYVKTTAALAPEQTRIEQIREAIATETISYGEIAELQDLAAAHPHLFAGEPELAQWAGMPEETFQRL